MEPDEFITFLNQATEQVADAYVTLLQDYLAEQHLPLGAADLFEPTLHHSDLNRITIGLRLRDDWQARLAHVLEAANAS